MIVTVPLRPCARLENEPVNPTKRWSEVQGAAAAAACCAEAALKRARRGTMNISADG